MKRCCSINLAFQIATAFLQEEATFPKASSENKLAKLLVFANLRKEWNSLSFIHWIFTVNSRWISLNFGLSQWNVVSRRLLFARHLAWKPSTVILGDHCWSFVYLVLAVCPSWWEMVVEARTQWKKNSKGRMRAELQQEANWTREVHSIRKEFDKKRIQRKRSGQELNESSILIKRRRRIRWLVLVSFANFKR